MSMSIVDCRCVQEKKQMKIGNASLIYNAVQSINQFNNNDAVCMYAVRCTPTVERDFAAVVPFLCDGTHSASHQQTFLGLAT
jgi:hypothetical protein